MKSVHIFNRLFRLPLLWGAATAGLFYFAIQQGTLRTAFLQRYTNSHWILQVEVCLFFGAISILIAKYFDISRQHRNLRRFQSDSAILSNETNPEAESFTTRAARSGRLEDYLTHRLQEVQNLVQRCRADHLDERLREYTDRDADRAHDDYGLVRLVIWAIPIFGFLGTVIGITLAIAQLNSDALEASMPQVTAGLGVAFDTTAVALTLSIVLMFFQYFVSRREAGLLAEVDSISKRAASQWAVSTHGGNDASNTLSSDVLGLPATVQAAYETFFAEARQQWGKMVADAGTALAEITGTSVASVMKLHLENIGALENTFAKQNQKEWTQVQQQLVACGQQLQQSQAMLSERTERLMQFVERLDALDHAEMILNRNLTALSGAKHFEQTVTSLAAAIQLLSLRLGDLSPEVLPLVTESVENSHRRKPLAA